MPETTTYEVGNPHIAAETFLAETVDRYQAAQMLGVHVGSIDRYLRDGLLPRIKIGPRLVRIPLAALTEMLEAQ